MLDILMPHIVLDRASIVTFIGKVEPTRMTEHVGVDWEADVCLQACTTNDLPD